MKKGDTQAFIAIPNIQIMIQNQDPYSRTQQNTPSFKLQNSNVYLSYSLKVIDIISMCVCTKITNKLVCGDRHFAYTHFIQRLQVTIIKNKFHKNYSADLSYFSTFSIFTYIITISIQLNTTFGSQQLTCKKFYERLEYLLCA